MLFEPNTAERALERITRSTEFKAAAVRVDKLVGVATGA